MPRASGMIARFGLGHGMRREGAFFGWQVVGAAALVATLTWGIAFYGPGVFLHALHAERGWSVSLISAAISFHFLASAPLMLRLASLHRRFGVVAVTRAGAIALGLGTAAWAWAPSPAFLFGAATLTGIGWALNGTAAINAFVSPWFDRRRPAALAMAYNGASLGGILMVPLWALLIGAMGFSYAAILVGIATAVVLWPVAGRWFGPTPVSLGLHADNDSAPPSRRPVAASHGPLWRQGAFRTLSIGFALGLLAQMGLLTQLFSLMVPALGTHGAGLAVSLATVCAVIGRTAVGWLLPPGVDRRMAAVANFGVQIAGSVALFFAGTESAPLLILGCVLFGLGIGNLLSLPPLIAQTEWPPEQVGRVVAGVAAVNQTFYSFAPALFGGMREFAGDWAVPAMAGVLQIASALVLIAGRRAVSRGG